MPPEVRRSKTDRIEAAARRAGQAPLLVGLLVLGVVLSITVVPSVFTVDDSNYLVNVVALRQGRVTLANTDSLPPSRELLFFDPTSYARAVESTPVGSTAPPLYAVLALPFSVFGWRGLVALNTLAYLVTIGMVFDYARRFAQQESTPWLAASAFAFGGYALEYALGVWPQALSFALCTAGIMAAGAVVKEGANRTIPAAAAGLLLAAATGVRYQNAVVLAAGAAAIALLTPSRRWAACRTYVAAAAVPLSVSTFFNFARFGSLNPISKGPGYLSVNISDVKTALIDPFVMFWGQVVDYTMRPPLTDRFASAWLRYDSMTGAHLIHGAIAKKAILQSAPWVILAFLVVAAAWVPGDRMPRGRRQQLRLLSLIGVAIIGTLSVSGVDRHDGLSFNARYFLELLPLAAIAFAWAMDGRLSSRVSTLAVGAALGVALVGVILVATPMLGGPDNPLWLARQLALMKLPLVLAAGLAGLWLLDSFGRGQRTLLMGMAGACLGWGLASHLTADVGMSQFMRSANLTRTHTLARLLPNGSALVAYWGRTDAVAPLLLTRDIVVIDPWADNGADAPVLIRALLEKGRRVFLLNEGLTPELSNRIVARLEAIPVTGTEVPLVELRAAQVGLLETSTLRATSR